MNREKLRKVKISRHEDGSGDFITNGYFHEWGKYPFVCDNGTIQITTAIIELENGQVKHFDANRLKFVEEF